MVINWNEVIKGAERYHRLMIFESFFSLLILGYFYFYQSLVQKILAFPKIYVEKYLYVFVHLTGVDKRYLSGAILLRYEFGHNRQKQRSVNISYRFCNNQVKTNAEGDNDEFISSSIITDHLQIRVFRSNKKKMFRSVLVKSSYCLMLGIKFIRIQAFPFGGVFIAVRPISMENFVVLFNDVLIYFIKLTFFLTLYN
ncbi:hypothetical protein EGR_10588 [Echinococcus granulosus]|uniref:Uncharacterized protein n=1 Tax=Echinococcus granulosus TaxID=6210 RepID=W6U1Z1_ECHGR|nr:hypothetical protein EGR_10588 [Echinococcus granulosus]EUB54546.1 hypothetical protein EGR_10588 [Echinococcus granulosus]